MGRSYHTGGRTGRKGFCHVHGKQTYDSRKAARADMKAAFPNERLNAFECEPGSGDWHFGHLNLAVVAGERRRDEFYQAAGGQAASPESQDCPCGHARALHGAKACFGGDLGCDCQNLT